MIGSPAFKHPDFRRLSVDAACNQFGMSGEHVVFGLLIFKITGSTAWVGVALALYLLPMLVLGPLSGAVADWLDRRTLLRVIECAIAVNLLVFSAVAAAGLVALWVLLVFVVVSGSARAMYQPARASYAYDIVGGDYIVSALGLLNLGSRVGQLAGALAAGALVERLGTPASTLTLAAAHVAAFAVLMRLRSAGDTAPAERVPIAQNLREYLAEMRGNRVLVMLVVITATVEVFGFSFATALPELAAVRFHLGAEGLGMMHAARATGGIIAALGLASLSGLRRRGTLYLAVIYAFGASLVVLAVCELYPLALMALVVVAMLATASDVLTQSMMQLSVANRLRGRAMGAWVLAIGWAPLGHLEMGVLATSLGVGGALAVNGAALVGVGVVATFAARGLRRL